MNAPEAESGPIAVVFVAAEADGARGSPVGSSTPRTGNVVPERLAVLTEKSNFWASALSIEHDRLHAWQLGLGYPVVVIGAVTGVAAFSQLNGSPAWWAKLSVAVIAIIAAVLAAVQTKADFAARGAAASACSGKFGSLYGKMLDTGDEIRAGKYTGAESDHLKSVLTSLYDEYEALKENRPPVSERVRAEARLAVLNDKKAMFRQQG